MDSVLGSVYAGWQSYLWIDRDEFLSGRWSIDAPGFQINLVDPGYGIVTWGLASSLLAGRRSYAWDGRKSSTGNTGRSSGSVGMTPSVPKGSGPWKGPTQKRRFTSSRKATPRVTSRFTAV